MRGVKLRFFYNVLFYWLVFYIISDLYTDGTYLCFFFPSTMQFGPVRLIVRYRKIWYFVITQHSFPPGCHEQTSSCSGTSATIVGTMSTACPKSWPVHPAGSGAVWVRSTHFCTTGLLCRLFQPWSSLIQSMYLFRSLSVLWPTFSFPSHIFTIWPF